MPTYANLCWPKSATHGRFQPMDYRGSLTSLELSIMSARVCLPHMKILIIEGEQATDTARRTALEGAGFEWHVARIYIGAGQSCQEHILGGRTRTQRRVLPRQTIDRRQIRLKNLPSRLRGREAPRYACAPNRKQTAGRTQGTPHTCRHRHPGTASAETWSCDADR